MAFIRCAKLLNCKLNPFINSLVYKDIRIAVGSGCFFNQTRYYRKSYATLLRIMKLRRTVVGPDRVRRRTDWDNWNYKAELYAFNARLNENMTEETLRCAFVHHSYLRSEEQKRKDLAIPTQDVQLDLQSNDSLIAQGHNIASNYIKMFVKQYYQKIPEAGINAIHDYLMSTEVLSHVSYNLGTSDLIFCAEYPPEKSTLAATLKAIIGSIAVDDSISRAEYFVLDFICPQLIGKDVLELWTINNPLNVLNEILVKHSLQECEPRLIFESGRNTIEAIYHVGLYSNREFLGRGPGETLANAVEMAAYDALRRILQLKENEMPIYFGQKARNVDLNSENITERYSEIFEANKSQSSGLDHNK